MTDAEAVEAITNFILRQSQPEEVRETLQRIIGRCATREDIDGLLSHYARNFVQIFTVEKRTKERTKNE